MSLKEQKRCKVGELRPSQVLTTFGVGAIVDLPQLSVMVMGLDDWQLKDAAEIGEPRLLASVRQALGEQVKSLRSAPILPEASHPTPFDPAALVGIPVAPFPRWMVCSRCQRLAPVDNNTFKLETGFRTDQIRFVHSNCPRMKVKPPTLLPARFLVACRHGHLDDFPWREYVHRGPTQCRGGLQLLETSASGEAARIFVKCELCGSKRPMSDAFLRDWQDAPICTGRRPHLRDHDDAPCKLPNGKPMRMQPMLQGASNSWFGLSLSALSIPQESGELRRLVEENWTKLEKVQNEQNIELLFSLSMLRELAEYSPAQVWQAVEEIRNAPAGTANEPRDLKSPEWEVLIDPGSVEKGRDFQLRAVAPPSRYARYFEKIVLAERLREVRALIGFSRIESPSDYDNPIAFPKTQQVPLSRTSPVWTPASEIRGEGLFFHFREDVVQQWVARHPALEAAFFNAHQRWRIARDLSPPEAYYPGLRFVLLHSFAHAVIRQLSVECGYTTSSLRERIYSRPPGQDLPPMSGVLIYTAAPDSEGTLGGLVSLGRPETLERHLDQALDNMRLCASDPLCAEHHPDHDDLSLHLAACHACLFAPETSCERGNRYLDRAVLVPTVEHGDSAFFAVDP